MGQKRALMTNGTNNKSTASGKGGNWREKLGISASERKREGGSSAPGGNSTVSPSSRERLTGGIEPGKTTAPAGARPAGSAPKKPVVRPAPLAPRRPGAGGKTMPPPPPPAAGKPLTRPAAPAGQGRTAMPGRPPVSPPGAQGTSADNGRLRPPPPPPGLRPAAAGGPKNMPGHSSQTPKPVKPATDDDFARRLRAQREAAERLAAQRAAVAGRPPFPGVTPPGGAAVPPTSPRPPAGNPAVTGGPARAPQPPHSVSLPPAAPAAGTGAAGRPPFTFADTDQSVAPAESASAAAGAPTLSTGGEAAAAPHAHHPDPVVAERTISPRDPNTGLEDVFEEDYAPETRRAAPEDYASAYSEFGEGFEEPPRRRGLGLLLFIMALLIVVAVAVGIVYFYQKLGGGGATPTGGAGVPVINPQQTPVKVKPKEPPAQARPKGRKQIYDRILGDGEEQPARIVPSEEKPLSPPGAPAGAAPDTGTNGGTGTEVDPLPLPLPPPPALDGGQGQMDGTEGVTETAQVAPAGGDAAEAKRIASLEPPSGTPEPPQPHSDTAIAEQASGASVSASDARTVASTTAAEAVSGGNEPARKILPKKVGKKAAPTTNATAADARVRKEGVTRPENRKRKMATATRKKVVHRQATPRGGAGGGPKSLIPPVALTPEVRAFASPGIPRAQEPVKIVPRKPVKVTNFATRHKVANFATGRPSTGTAATGRTPMTATPAPIRVARNSATPARPEAPVRNVAAAKGYVVQLASYRSREDALREYQRMRARHAALLGGLPPRIEKKDLGAAGVFYRLAVGPLPSRDQARKLCNALIARGERDCLVRRR